MAKTKIELPNPRATAHELRMGAMEQLDGAIDDVRLQLDILRIAEPIAGSQGVTFNADKVAANLRMLAAYAESIPGTK